MSSDETRHDRRVRQFREILLWPLQLLPQPANTGRHPWDSLTTANADHPWRKMEGGLLGPAAGFNEARYAEFVHFLPHAQRFLYGSDNGRAVLHVFQRNDIAQVSITLQRGTAPLLFQVDRVQLYFFYDIDVAILAVEIHADNLSLMQAQDMLDRFRRAYPVVWSPNGEAQRCPAAVTWLSARGTPLATANYHDRDAYLSFTHRYHLPPIATHWAYLLYPLVLASVPLQPGQIPFRPIEDDRIPLLSYLALEDPHQLSRSDFIRLGLAIQPGDSDTLPYAASFLHDFEYRYCYDRYWERSANHTFSNSRYICCGHAFTLIGQYNESFFTDARSGLLAHFRGPYFLLGLIVHFHKAALLVLSDCFALAVNRLDASDPASVKVFQREMRQMMEVLLRFEHRYWFNTISNQVQAKELYHHWRQQLGAEELYAEVKAEAQDVNQYLDTLRAKRQADIGVRLGVVATFGLMGGITVGFLGMNIIDASAEPLPIRILYLVLAFIPCLLLTLYTISISKILADFLDALTNPRLSWWGRLRVLAKAFRRSATSP